MATLPMPGSSEPVLVATAAPNSTPGSNPRLRDSEAPLKSTAMWLVAMALPFCFVQTAGAQECYESSILSPTPFMGNDGEVFKLADGSVWEVKYEYEYLYEYYPDVIICPSRGRLILDETSLNVEPLSSGRRSPGSSRGPLANTPGQWVLVEETQLKGRIRGTVRQGRIFKTVSGNIYEVRVSEHREHLDR